MIIFNNNFASTCHGAGDVNQNVHGPWLEFPLNLVEICYVVF